MMSVLAPACPREVLACGAQGRFDGVAPLVTGEREVQAISATSDVPGDLQRSETLFVRVAFDRAVNPSASVFIDADGDRMTGMWTLQSSISSAGWNLLADGDGKLLTHAGTPNVWQWRDAGAQGFGRTVTDGVVDFCIPVRALGTQRPSRVRIAALAGQTWLPKTFLPGAAYPPQQTSPPGAGPPAAARLAFQYSATPWVIRDCTGDMSCAAAAYARFDHLVLGSGLEEPSHGSHTGAAELIRAIRDERPDIEIWGYVSLIGGPARDGGRRSRVHKAEDVLARAASWAEMGADGVFLDEADLCEPAWGQRCAVSPDGEAVAVTRERQTEAVNGIHDMGMPVFVNAFSPLDVLGEVRGVPSPFTGAGTGRRADMYLLENPTVAAGAPRTGLDAEVSAAKYEFARRARTATGVRIAAVDTFGAAVTDRSDLAEYVRGWKVAQQARVDAYGFTNASYSASGIVAKNLALLEPPGG